MENHAPKTKILYISFNQDVSCFVIGTNKGYRIYDILSPDFDFYERFLDGGIAIIEMMNKSNILFMVGGGDNPKFSSSSVVLFDDRQGKKIGEIPFNSEILSCKVKKDYLLIITDEIIEFIDLCNGVKDDIIVKQKINYISNICNLTLTDNINLISYPDEVSGIIIVKNYTDFNNAKITNIRVLDEKEDIYMAEFNQQATLIACTSKRCDKIRVFHIQNKACLIELITESNNLSFSNFCSLANCNFFRHTSCLLPCLYYSWMCRRCFNYINNNYYNC